MSEPGGSAVGEIGGLVAGGLAVLAAIGGAIRWVAGWAKDRGESRSARNRRWEEELDARERAMEASLSENLARCERHCAEMRSEIEKLVDASRRMTVVIELLLPELARRTPASPIIAQARKMLAEILPAELTRPAPVTDEMQDLLKQIDADR